MFNNKKANRKKEKEDKMKNQVTGNNPIEDETKKDEFQTTGNQSNEGSETKVPDDIETTEKEESIDLEKEENNDLENDETEKINITHTPDKPILNKLTDKKEFDTVVAFYKQTPDSNWTLFPQAFISEEQATKKLDLMSNPNEIHLTIIDLPK